MSELELEPLAPSALIESAADGEFALAQGFSTRLGHLARQAGANPAAARWVERAAFAISRATSGGHVCIALEALLQQAGEIEQRLDPARRQRPAQAWQESPVQVRARLRAILLGSGMVCDGQAASAALTPLVLDRDDRLYLARYYAYERQLAQALVQRAAAPQAAVSSAAADAGLADQWQAFFKPPEEGQVDWQRVAAVLAVAGRLTVISGGPGTGKTTTVVAILAGLLAQAGAAQPLRIALAAPTGKAAQRMQEALLERADRLPPEVAARLPRHSYTLHRLLGVGPGGRFRHHRDAPLPYDVIVIDEASMIDVALAARLVDAVPPASRLILLGDKDQLSAVEAGAVFAELSARPRLSSQRLASLAPLLQLSVAQLAAALPPLGAGADSDDLASVPLIDCVVWLERNYRFGLDSPIGRLSLAIKAGAAADALALLAGHPDSAVLHEEGGASLTEAALVRLADGYRPYAAALRQILANPQGQEEVNPAPLFEAFNRYRVLCAVRAGVRGVAALNTVLAVRVRALAAHGETVAAAAHGVGLESPWYAGRPVMVTRNDYGLGLFNGDIGIALPLGSGGSALRVVFRNADGSYRAVAPAALPPHDTAFAMTVHKSQGSEFIHAALVLPAAFSRGLTRELVYTAVTRARQQVAIYASVEVLAQAIAARTARDSGLAARLAEAAQALRDTR